MNASHDLRLPGWLQGDAPSSDVILSTRIRIMRNLQGFPFTNRASDQQLIQIEKLFAEKTQSMGLSKSTFLTQAERDHLVMCRLVAPDFAWQSPGRSVYINSSRDVSLMVNEEDHLRLQVVKGGWQLPHSHNAIDQALDGLKELHFAFTKELGYLAASPTNLGLGIRQSVLAHLIGLAHQNRLKNVLSAISTKGLIARGAFGESSRAVGALTQMSDTTGDGVSFAGACEYLIQEERRARKSLDFQVVENLVTNARQFVQTQSALTLADSLRSLAYLRWGADQKFIDFSIHQIDQLIIQMDLGETAPKRAAEQRAKLLRTNLSL